MYRIALIALAILSTTALSNAADDSQWKLFNFSKTTPDKVVMFFGPPSIIKTEDKYSDWIKNQAQGCGQLHIYVMSYSIWTEDLNILKGPLGKASEAEVAIDDGKVCDVLWIYDNNQLEPAFQQWMGHKGLTRIGGKKPTVVMIGIWKPNKGTIVTAECYTGGDGKICRGPISVHYSEDTEK